MKKRIAIGLFFVVFGGSFALNAQSGTTGSGTGTNSVNPATAAPAPEIAWPQWAKDLRRADIIAFGVFPFAWFFTSIALDLMRSAEHNWQDQRYYPWPLAPKDAVPWSNGDYAAALGIAAAAAITVALIDFVIIKIRRNKTEARKRAYTPNPPVIKRERFAEDAGETASPGPPAGSAPVQEGPPDAAAP